MDAIRKKMQSLKSETDSLYATIARFEDETKEANALSDKYECDIRDVGKKTQSYEVEFDETMDKLTKALANLEEREKAFKSAEEDVSALTRYLKNWFQIQISSNRLVIGKIIRFVYRVSN